MADEITTTRGRLAAGALALVVTSFGIAHFAHQHLMDARVLEVRTSDAARLAEVQEQSAEQRIEREGQLAECRLELEHARAEVRDDVTVDGTIVEVSGAAPVQPGGPGCRVELGWSHDPLDGCRALVRCGSVSIYGGPGAGYFDDCTLDERGLVRGEDPNPSSDGGDPRLSVNRVDRTLTVSDDGPDWSVRIALPPIGEDPPHAAYVPTETTPPRVER